MAQEEFQESELIFAADGDRYNSDQNLLNKNITDKKKKMSSSVPVDITKPAMHRDDYDVEDDRGGFEPPHVIAGRRIAAQVAAFSVSTGNGRKLKGRDLSQVRNSVLRMTGFLEI